MVTVTPRDGTSASMTAPLPIDTHEPIEIPGAPTIDDTGRLISECGPKAAKSGRSADSSVRGGGKSLKEGGRGWIPAVLRVGRARRVPTGTWGS